MSSMLLATALLAVVPVETEHDAVERFALVIGYNGSLAGRPSLQFADDDAFRTAELLRRIVPAESLHLLTQPDVQSESRFDDWRGLARIPSRGNLERAVRTLAEAMTEARTRGAFVVAYVYYAGHGDLVEGFTSLSLADGYLSNLELEDSVLSKLPADRIHLIVDACNAGALLAYRGDEDGPKPRRVRRVKRQTRSMRAFFERLPHVGVVMSTSQAERSFEDPRYESGLFSHVMRSGLLGGADVDDDGRVTYRELRAFLQRAFETVRPAVFQPNTLVHAPYQAMRSESEARETILAFEGQPTIDLEPGLEGHVILEDDRRLRVAELNKPNGRTVRWMFPRAGRRRYALLKPSPRAASGASCAGSSVPASG